MKTNIRTITTQLNDIPHISTTVWYSGCNLSCGGCHNTSLEHFNDGLSMEQLKDELIERYFVKIESAYDKGLMGGLNICLYLGLCILFTMSIIYILGISNYFILIAIIPFYFMIKNNFNFNYGDE
jgi:hypothetical protein